MAFYFSPALTFTASLPLPEDSKAQKLLKAAQALERAGVAVPAPVVPLIPKARL